MPFEYQSTRLNNVERNRVVLDEPISLGVASSSVLEVVLELVKELHSLDRISDPGRCTCKSSLEQMSALRKL